MGKQTLVPKTTQRQLSKAHKPWRKCRNLKKKTKTSCLIRCSLNQPALMSSISFHEDLIYLGHFQEFSSLVFFDIDVEFLGLYVKALGINIFDHGPWNQLKHSHITATSAASWCIRVKGGAWWLSDWVSALRLDGRTFESHSSCHIETLGKSFTHSYP